MLLSDVQLGISPFAKGMPWREWWAINGHIRPSEAEMKAWAARAAVEEAEIKAFVKKMREEHKKR